MSVCATVLGKIGLAKLAVWECRIMPTVTLEISLFSWIVSGFAAAFAFYRYTVTRLDRPDSRAWYIKLLKEPFLLKQYEFLLRTGLKKLDEFFGNQLSFQAIGTCIFLSLLYSLTFFLASWLLGGPSKIGKVVILPDDLPIWRKLIFLLLCLFIGMAIYKFSNSWNDSLRRRTHRRSLLIAFEAATTAFLIVFIASYVVTETIFNSLLMGLGGGIIVLLIGIGTWVAFNSRDTIQLKIGKGRLSEATSFIVTVGVTVIAVGSGLLVAIAAGAGVSSGVGILCMIAAGTGTVYATRDLAVAKSAAMGGVAVGGLIIALLLTVFVVPLKHTAIFSLVIFVGILPIFNAFWDWISWGISRSLGRRLLSRSRRTFARILGHAVIDLGAGVFLLLGLAVTLFAAVSFYNKLYAQLRNTEPPLGLQAFSDKAATDPWGDGLWISLMLLSTLVPTALHFVMALGGILTGSVPEARRLAMATRLKKRGDEKSKILVAVYYTASLPISIVAMLGVASIALFVIGEIWEPVSLIIYKTAVCITENMAECLHAQLRM